MPTENRINADKGTPDSIAPKEKLQSTSGGPSGPAGKGESNMANGAMPDAPIKYDYAPDPQGPDGQKDE